MKPSPKFPLGTWVRGPANLLRDGGLVAMMEGRVVRAVEMWSRGPTYLYYLVGRDGQKYEAAETDLKRSPEVADGWEPREST